MSARFAKSRAEYISVQALVAGDNTWLDSSVF